MYSLPAETKAGNKTGDKSEDRGTNVGDIKAGDGSESKDIGDLFDDLHLAGTEADQDPYKKLNDYIRQFRATPYATMKKCPAEEGVSVKNLCFLYQAETEEYKAKYQAETETEGVGDKDLSFLDQAETKEYEAKYQAETGVENDFCQAETEAEAKYQADGDKNLCLLYQ